jgi:hypothetical protein
VVSIPLGEVNARKMLELYPEPVNPLPLLAFGAHG